MAESPDDVTAADANRGTSPRPFKSRRAAAAIGGRGSEGGAPFLRRRSTFGGRRQGSSEPSPGRWPPRRRGSTLSDLSYEARATLNPSVDAAVAPAAEPSAWEAVPLAVALFPAVGGILVKGGNAFVTDLMLLLLGAVFLNWSVTQPWSWYRSAQQIREETEEQDGELMAAVESESDKDDDVLADDNDHAKHRAPNPRRAARAAALGELYVHEDLALVSCFVSPVLGACLLHAIRGQLSRPSEGLVSNYNLTIFMLCAEIRPLRHLIKLVQARTLHLQRVVHANPYRDRDEHPADATPAAAAAAADGLGDLLTRLDELESRVGAAKDHPDAKTAAGEPAKTARREKDDVVQELLEQIKPSLNTLASAIRRTHRQQRAYAEQVESRLRAIDTKASSAVTVAKVAERKSRTLWTSIAWLFDCAVFFAFLPLRLALGLGTWSLAWFGAFLFIRRGVTKRPPSPPPPPDPEKPRPGSRTPSAKPGTRSAPRASKK